MVEKKKQKMEGEQKLNVLFQSLSRKKRSGRMGKNMGVSFLSNMWDNE